MKNIHLYLTKFNISSLGEIPCVYDDDNIPTYMKGIKPYIRERNKQTFNINNSNIKADLLVCDKTTDLTTLCIYALKSLRLMTYILDNVIKGTITNDLNSNIVQSIMFQEVKLSNIILNMNENYIFEQEFILRSICELYIDIGWLLNSAPKSKITPYDNKNNGEILLNSNQDPFELYKYSGVLNMRNSYNISQKSLANDKKEKDKSLYLLDHYIMNMSKHILKYLNLPVINKILASSKNHIHQHDMPKLICRSHFVHDGRKTYAIFKLLSESVHSNSFAIISRNSLRTGSTYKMQPPINSMNFNSMINCSNFLYNSFKLIESYITFNNNSQPRLDDILYELHSNLFNLNKYWVLSYSKSTNN